MGAVCWRLCVQHNHILHKRNAGGAALRAGAPEDGFFVRWSPKGERQTEIGRLGVQPNQYAVVGGSQPPAWRAYGAYLRVQNSVLSVRST